ncbi:MAG: HAD-IC family P-type ATPase [Proteobacteria bacterium]|nr:HAD-IC family P-type ATPase [Pseudomonadota bacterium]
MAPPPAEAGLTTADAAARLARFGPNAVADPKPSLLADLVAKFWAPVPWMLEAAIVLQAVLGAYLEAAVIAALLAFNALLAFAQESRAQTALAALKSRLALNASVRRDGAWVTLPVRALVADDVVKLSLGAVVPADVTLLAGAVLLDQSMLTGESLPVEGGPGTKTYAGALIRRGEATAVVTATGTRTYFGRTAELVRLAHAESAEQRAVLGVVRNLAVLNGGVLVAMVADAVLRGLPAEALIALVLTAILASVPVALPATFTLATALGAQRLVRRGVLPTRLAAVHEAATMDVLCSDKTGTLTQNALTLAGVHPFAGGDEAGLLALAAAASADGGQDPVDGAVRAAAAARGVALPDRHRFIPFDPATKRAEALLGDGRRVLKGAFAAIAPLAAPDDTAAAAVAGLAAAGHRVLAVAAGPAAGPLRLIGLLALSDPPRTDSAALVAALAGLGVRTVMVTGDAPETAAVIARAVGLTGAVCPARTIPDHVRPGDFAVFAGVLPEDKYHLVKAFQAESHTVGMCGDGANDAPALRQAEIGIAVASATDVAKAAAGLVLTEPGLSGILAAVEEGRATFQRLLTYTLTTLIRKIEVVAFLFVGLLLTGQAVLTPMLMVLFLLANDFLTMSLTTDRARASPQPDAWRMGAITRASAVLGLANLAFATALLGWGWFGLGLAIGPLRTFAFVVLVAGSQATLYVVRERRRLWSSRPGGWIVASSLVDLAITLAVAFTGVLTPALGAGVVAAVLAGAAAFALALDVLKGPVFAWAGIAAAEGAKDGAGAKDGGAQKKQDGAGGAPS